MHTHFSAAYRTYGVKLFVLVTMIMLILAGCGQQTDTSKSDAAATTNTKKESQPVQSEEYTVKHAMGETKIKGTPKKVVVLTNEGTEAVLSMGIKPIGAVKSFTLGDRYDHIKADMEGVKIVGDENQPNLEMIASLKPDLIIGNKVRQEKVYE